MCMKTEKQAKTICGAARRRVVLVGTYKGDQLVDWPGWYCWPLRKDDFNAEPQRRGEKKRTDLLAPDGARGAVSRVSGEQIRVLESVTELWLFQGTKEQKNYKAGFVGVKTREELVRNYGYPAAGKPHGDRYALFKTELLYRHRNEPQEEADAVIVRTRTSRSAPRRSPRSSRPTSNPPTATTPTSPNSCRPSSRKFRQSGYGCAKRRCN